MQVRADASIGRRFGWAAALLVVAVAGGWLWWRGRPQPTPYDLARYSPREAFFFVEAAPLPAALRRLETLAFWKAIRPAIGVPGQLDDLLTGARLAAWLDAGPAEARLLARARWGLIVTGLTAEVAPAKPQLPTGQTPPPDGGGATLDVTPRFTLCLTTDPPAEQTLAVARDRLPLAARKLFGGDAQLSEQTYQGVALLCFRHPERPAATLWAAADGTALLLANDEAAIQACLDAAAGRRAAVADLPAFQQARRAVGGDQAILFAFANPTGLDAALRLGANRPAAEGMVSVNGQTQSLTASLLAEFSAGLGYSLDIQNGRVVDRYHLALHPNIVAELRPHLAPPSVKAANQFAAFTDGVTLIGLSRPLTALDRIQAAVAARSNAAVAFFTRELVAGLREQYGVRPREPLDDALGDQWLLLSPEAAPDGKTIVGIQVRDKARVLPTLDRHLRADGASLVNPSPTHFGVPLVVSTHRDRRAACFVDDWLLLGDQPTLERLLKRRQAATTPLPILPPTPTDAFLHLRHRSQEDLKSATLALITLTRAGDPAPSRLEETPVRQAIEQQPPATGYLRLGADGCFGEMHSPIGNLAYLASFLTAE